MTGTKQIVATKITADNVSVFFMTFGASLLIANHEDPYNIATGSCLIVLGFLISGLRHYWNEKRKEPYAVPMAGDNGPIDHMGNCMLNDHKNDHPLRRE